MTRPLAYLPQDKAMKLYKDHLVLMAMLSTSELVARIREATGDTQEGLARRLDVSFPTVNAWERGRSNPRAGHRRILEQLGSELGIHHQMTVLVIDDDPSTGEVVAALASEIDGGITVDMAADGWEGLVKCGSIRPDLLFLDIMMPGIDGLEVARRIPSISGLDAMTVVFVSSSRDDRLLARARSLGHAVIEKPLSFEDLTRTMRAVLAGRRVTAANIGDAIK